MSVAVTGVAVTSSAVRLAAFARITCHSVTYHPSLITYHAFDL
jgi:hypothetical protein